MLFGAAQTASWMTSFRGINLSSAKVSAMRCWARTTSGVIGRAPYLADHRLAGDFAGQAEQRRHLLGGLVRIGLDPAADISDFADQGADDRGIALGERARREVELMVADQPLAVAQGARLQLPRRRPGTDPRSPRHGRCRARRRRGHRLAAGTPAGCRGTAAPPIPARGPAGSALEPLFSAIFLPLSSATERIGESFGTRIASPLGAGGSWAT